MSREPFDILLEYGGEKYRVTLVRQEGNKIFQILNVTPSIILDDSTISFDATRGFTWSPETVHKSFKPILAKQIGRLMNSNA